MCFLKAFGTKKIHLSKSSTVNCLRLYIILSENETRGIGEGGIYDCKFLAELEVNLMN